VTSLTQVCCCRKESKENEMSRKRESLDDTRKILHEKEQELLKEQAILNQKDENILERLAYITQTEKRLKDDKLNLEGERKVLEEEKNKLDLKMQAIFSREEVCIDSLPSFICGSVSTLKLALRYKIALLCRLLFRRNPNLTNVKVNY
jgi:hypothetical protein